MDEVRHYGCVSIASPAGVQVFGDDVPKGIPLRSTGKPFFLGALLSSVLRGESFSDRELALMSSSHNGEPQHVSVAIDLLTRYGLSPEMLHCGIHEKWRPWTIHSPLGNNCSGKHAAFLIASKVAGVDLRDYLNPDGEVHALVRSALRDVFACVPLAVGVDGCSIPTYSFPLQAIATAYRDFASDNLGECYSRVRRAHLAAPFYVGGTDRLESYLISAYGLAAKSGSAGLWTLGIPALQTGIAVKVWGGAEAVAQAVLLELLRKRDVLDPTADEYLRGYYNRALHSLAGRESGAFQVCFQEQP